MFLFLKFLFFIIYFFIVIYGILDKKILYTSQGSKIMKYLDKNNLKSVSTALDYNNANSKSPISSKQGVLSLLITINIAALDLIFSYELIFLENYYIKIFDNYIVLSKIFGELYIYLKFIYFVGLICFFYSIVYVIVLKISNIKPDEKRNTMDFEVGKDLLLCKPIYFKRAGMYQNILITGSIGSGKTSSVFTNLLEYLILKNIKGLILDVKGNYIDTIKRICKKYDKNFLEISLNGSLKYNPLNTKENNVELAHKLRLALDNLTEKNNSDSYFLDKTESYIKDFITIIKVYNKVPTFNEIHKLVVDKEYLIVKLNEIKKIILSKEIGDDDLFEIGNSINNLKNEYLKLDDRTFNIIRSEITRITDIFVSNYKVNEMFCSTTTNIDFHNNIVVLSMDLASNKKLAKVISTYLKLDFQRSVLSKHKDIFFFCDEYQEFCNKEDAHFFSLSREFRCINVVAMQSYTSLKNSLNSEESSKVIIQNFVNKIWFRNDDIYTIEEAIKQIGKEIKEKVSINLNESSKESNYSIFKKDFNNVKSNISSGYTILKENEDILNINHFTRDLNTFEICCILTDSVSQHFYKKVSVRRWKMYG